MAALTVFTLEAKNGDVVDSSCATSVFIGETNGTIPIASLTRVPSSSCWANDLPFLFAYQMEKPPTRLLLADPAPRRAISLKRDKSIFKLRALLAANATDAKAAAEKPTPFAFSRLFLLTTLTWSLVFLSLRRASMTTMT